MIDRYKDETISSLFSEQYKYKIFTLIELRTANSLYKKGIIKYDEWNEINSVKKYPKVAAVKSFERETKHETAAFVKALQILHKDAGKRWLHYGMTSSDLLDTHMAIITKSAIDVVNNKTDSLINTIRKAIKDKGLDKVIQAGRTHGMIAEKIPCSQRFSNFLISLHDMQILLNSVKDCIYGKLSGPVGTNAFITEESEKEILEEFDIKVAPIKLQIVPRHYNAIIMNYIAVLGNILSKFATDIRLLQMDGINELSEGFSDKQYGSSAMPHKKNPITSEKICGLARMLNAYNGVALDNIVLWLERDMSHSSSERIIIEDAFHIICHMLDCMSDVVKELHINYENILKNIKENEFKLNTHTILCDKVAAGEPRNNTYTGLQRLLGEK